MKTGSVPVHPHIIFHRPNAYIWQSGAGDNVYGVIGIPLQKETLDSFEYSILLSVINECALAMENAQNAMEKEKNAVLAKNEQMRADLLRAISHDLRTPLCSISGNADMLA
ncbi:histidine kinase dimerization/phospho-acceptor domain-containing protein [Blautia stercoris]